jgi:hypothetical protein
MKLEPLVNGRKPVPPVPGFLFSFTRRRNAACQFGSSATGQPSAGRGRLPDILGNFGKGDSWLKSGFHTPTARNRW